MRLRIFALILVIALVIPAAGWAKGSVVDPNGGSSSLDTATPSPTAPTDTVSDLSRVRTVARAASAPGFADSPGDVSGRSFFQQLLAWIQARLAAM